MSGVEYERFAVGLDLSTMPEAAQFVAREYELARMHELLWGHPTRSIVVLHGLGGVGKSQLAIQYVKRHKEKYTAVFWLNANSAESLQLSFGSVVRQVLRDHPSASPLAGMDLESNLGKVVEAVQTWLNSRKNTRWLIIFDNYDNPNTPGNTNLSAIDVCDYLPKSDHGSIIITTRSSRVTNGERIHVQSLTDMDDSLEILSNTSGREDIKRGTFYGI